jgi:hypothetical protein
MRKRKDQHEWGAGGGGNANKREKMGGKWRTIASPYLVTRVLQWSTSTFT